MILALILTPSQGVVEIRSDGAFNTPQECIEHLQRRAQHQDFRRGDISGSCVPAEKMEAVIRALFGGKA